MSLSFSFESITTPMNTDFASVAVPSAPTNWTYVPHSIESVERSIASPELDRISMVHLINGEHFSGAERVQQLLGKRLPEFGIDAQFICLKHGKFRSLCGLPDKQVTTISMRNRIDLSIVDRVIEHVRAHGSQLIHAHTPRTALIASFVSRRCRIPWVYHVHSPTARDSARNWMNRINDWVERWSLRNAHHIITVSRSLRRELLQRGVPRQRVSAIANGVACQNAIDTQARLHDQHWRLGMIALIRPRKGIESLLQALALLGQDCPRVTLDVIGGFETESYEADVRKTIRNLQLQSVVNLCGFTNDVPAAIRKLDGMVLPSLFGEGMPMVVLEAIACGVPVIATRVEGTPEVIRHGLEGLLAAPGNPASIADAVRQFVSDREAWAIMSANAWDLHRERFSDEQMALRTAKIYRRVVGAGVTGRR